MVPIRTRRRRRQPQPPHYRVPPTLAGRRSRVMDPVHRPDRRRNRLGRIRYDARTARHLDLLAWERLARRLARSWPGWNRRSVGKTRLAAARNDRERPPGVPEAESVLRFHLDRLTGHLARRSHSARSPVLLPRLRALPRLLEAHSSWAADRRGGSR